MSKAEKFIQDYTRNCSNELQCYDGDCNPQIIYSPWLTPDQARRAVEIAREEIYKWLYDNYHIYRKPMIDDLKQAMKDE